MYVYKEIDKSLWHTGFYDPDGKFIEDGVYKTAKEAAARVNYLNGGPNPNMDKLAEKIIEYQRKPIHFR